jgi:hypothetical protein
MDSDLPDLIQRLSSVTAEIEGTDYQDAKAKVLAWQRSLLHRLVRPDLERLAGVDVRMMETEAPSLDAYRPEEN